MGPLFVLLDLAAVVAVGIIAWALIRKYIWQPAMIRARDSGYEKGFADAIKYFGMTGFYRENPHLKERRDRALDELELSDRLRAIESRLQERDLLVGRVKAKHGK